MPDLQVNITGLDELFNAFDTLPDKIADNIMRGAMRAAAKPVLEEAKRNVNVQWGTLESSLKIGTKREKDKVTAKVYAPGFQGFKALWLEYGTKAHFLLVPDEQKATNVSRSRKAGQIVKESTTTFNRRFAVIGGKIVSGMLKHPGSRPFPFLRPALDSKASDAVMAAALYIQNRMKTKHGLETPELLMDGDE